MRHDALVGRSRIWTVDGAGHAGGKTNRMIGIGYHNRRRGVIDSTSPVEHGRDNRLQWRPAGPTASTCFNDSGGNRRTRSLLTNTVIFDYPEETGITLSGAGLNVDVEHNTIHRRGTDQI